MLPHGRCNAPGTFARSASSGRSGGYVTLPETWFGTRHAVVAWREEVKRARELIRADVNTAAVGATIGVILKLVRMIDGKRDTAGRMVPHARALQDAGIESAALEATLQAENIGLDE